MPLYFIVIYYLTKVFMGKGKASPPFKRVIFIWLQGATFSLSNHMFKQPSPPLPSHTLGQTFSRDSMEPIRACWEGRPFPGRTSE